jgi:hypothetical protein
VVAEEVLTRCHVGASRRSVGCRGIAHPVGNRGPEDSCSPAGVVVVPLAGASRRAAARAARRCSICAWRERWPERHQRRGVGGPAASACAGAGASAAGMVGTGPGLVDRHGWSSSWLVMRMR